MVTVKGVPFGVASSATIDASGGTVTSADGRLTVTIPPGALTTATTIGIQPITNEIETGVGLGYDLTPNGQAFAVPITVTFAYADFDLAGTSADFLGMAYQDPAGQWHSLDNPVVDKAQRMLSIQATHFTPHAAWGFVGIVPASATVGLGKSVDLQVKLCTNKPDPNDPSGRQIQGCSLANGNQIPLGNWSVNGAPGGSVSTGTVAQTDASDSSAARYTAPLTNASRSVAVSVDYLPPNPKDKQTLVSNIFILDCPLANQPDGHCPVQYVGTTKGSYFNTDGLVTWQATAQVTFTESQVLGNLVAYTPSGTIHVFNVQVGGCTMTLSPSTFDISPTNIVIDFGVTPPRWSGQVSAAYTPDSTGVCTDGSTPSGPLPIGVGYFGDNDGDNDGGNLAADGSGFTGTAHPLGGTVTYSFINAFRAPKAGH